ncbi:MAG: hypothetical protein R3D62_01840 [Xanthobacteraceae bacterium]
MMRFSHSWFVSARVPCRVPARRGRHRSVSRRRLLAGLGVLVIAIAFVASAASSGAGSFVIWAAAAESPANGRAKEGNAALAKNRCLSRQEQRARIAARAAIPLGKAVRAVKGRGDLLRARLCERRGKLFYLLTLLGRGGKVLRVTIDARTGRLVGAPR